MKDSQYTDRYARTLIPPLVFLCLSALSRKKFNLNYAFQNSSIKILKKIIKFEIEDTFR